MRFLITSDDDSRASLVDFIRKQQLQSSRSSSSFFISSVYFVQNKILPLLCDWMTPLLASPPTLDLEVVDGLLFWLALCYSTDKRTDYDN